MWLVVCWTTDIFNWCLRSLCHRFNAKTSLPAVSSPVFHSKLKHFFRKDSDSLPNRFNSKHYLSLACLIVRWLTLWVLTCNRFHTCFTFWLWFDWAPVNKLVPATFILRVLWILLSLWLWLPPDTSHYTIFSLLAIWLTCRVLEVNTAFKAECNRNRTSYISKTSLTELVVRPTITTHNNRKKNKF